MIAETSSAGYIHPQVQLINPTDDDMQLPAGYELGQTQLYEGLVAKVRVDPAGGQDQGGNGPPLWAWVVFFQRSWWGKKLSNPQCPRMQLNKMPH